MILQSVQNRRVLYFASCRWQVTACGCTSSFAKLTNFWRKLQAQGFYITQMPRMMPWGWRHAYPPQDSPQNWGNEVPQWIYQLWDYIVRGALELPRTPPSWLDIPQMMRLTITTCNVLEMLGDWEIARPYNFLLLPMIDPLYGIAFHRKSDEKVLLVCAYSSIQKDWISMECVNVYDGKKCGMLNCRKTAGNIPYNVVFPSQLGQLVIQYQKHPEAKSLAPDGTVCLSDHSKLANGYHLKTGQ